MSRRVYTEKSEEIIIRDNYYTVLRDVFSIDLKNVHHAKNKKIITTEDFINRINKKNKLNNFILPRNTRYTYTSPENKHILVLEEEPQMRTIKIQGLNINRIASEIIKKKSFNDDYINELKNNNFSSNEEYSYNVAFPYIIYFINLDSRLNVTRIKIFYRNKPLTSLGDDLYSVNLLNVNGNNLICLGDGDTNLYRNSLILQIENILNRFWFNTFNCDYIGKYELYENVEEVSTILHWEYYSKTDPLFVYKNIWKKTEYTVNNIINSLKNTDVIANKNYVFNSIFYNITSEDLETIDESQETLNFVVANNKQDTITINIGDKLIYDNKEQSFYAFGFNVESDLLNYIKIIDENLNITKIEIKRWDTETKNLFYSYIESYNNITEIKLNNGEVLKIGDIFQTNISPSSIFYKVDKIRRNLLNSYEILTTSNNKILIDDNIKIINKFTNINGLEIKVGNYYFLNNEFNINSFCKIKCFKLVKLIEIIHIRHSLKFKIQTIDSGIEDIITIDDLDCLIEPFIIDYELDKIYNSNTNIIPYNVSKEEQYVYNSKYINFNEIVRRIFNEDLTELNIYDINNINNINLKIGDNFCILNWSTPNIATSIKTITGFIVNEENKQVFITYSDQNDNMHNIEFINNNKINSDIIQKLETNVNGLHSGDKIKAKIPYIPYFPKIHVNQIIGFFVNNIKTLVFCSNGLTLDFDFVISNFDILKYDNEKYNKLDIQIPNLEKIPFQCNDLISYKYKTYAFLFEYDYLSLKEANSLQSISMNLFRNIDLNNFRIGILSPRIHKKDIPSIKNLKPGLPDYTGRSITYDNLNDTIYKNNIYKILEV